MWHRFIKLSVLLIAIQLVFWILLLGLVVRVSPWGDSILNVALLYYPIIKFIEMRGHFVGDSNIIYPLYGGILIGIPLYGIAAAALITLVSRAMRQSSSLR